MEVPTLEPPASTRIHLVGGEKGGVGKSMLARLLAQYFVDRGIPFTGHDSDRSHGALLRFYPGHASPLAVDRYEALDRIVEDAVEHPGRRVLVDLAAQTHAPLLAWIDESGVLDLADVSGVAIDYWHVADTGRDSVGLLSRLLDRFGQRVRYVVVRNHLRGDDFTLLDRSGQLERAAGLGAQVIDIKRLHEGVVRKLDGSDSRFDAARQGGEGAGLGLMERQRLKTWLAHAYAEIDRIRP